MDDGPWIIVRNWRRFQHYHDRDPVWIKLYTSLGSDPEWRALSAASRGILATIWIEYARTRGRAHRDHIASSFGAGSKHAYLNPLVDAGFIALSASKPLALRYTREEVLRTSSKSAEQRASKRPLRRSAQDEETAAPP